MLLHKLGNTENVLCMILFVLYPILSYVGFPGNKTLISILYILVFIYYFRDFRFRRIVCSYPLLIWLLLTIYHSANAYFKQVPGVNYIDFVHGLKIYSCLAIFAFWGCVDFSKTISMLLNSFILMCLIMTVLLVAGGGIDGEERLSGAGYSATGVGQSAALIGIFLSYSIAIKKINIHKAALLYVIPVFIILLSQSRNSMMMLSLSIISSFFIYSCLKSGGISHRSIVMYLFFSIILLMILLPLFENTALAERFISGMNMEDSRTMSLYGTGTLFDKIVGDRIVYYVLGWELFAENIWTGIGLWNFRVVTGGTYPLHSEYMVHLCEGGLVATVLWLMFVFYIIKAIYEYNGLIGIKLAAFFSVVIILFCALYTREFFSQIFYPVYGLIISLKLRKSKVL